MIQGEDFENFDLRYNSLDGPILLYNGPSPGTGMDFIGGGVFRNNAATIFVTFKHWDDREVAAQELVGEFQWQVPLYSATKVEGKKLCDYGREGEADHQPAAHGLERVECPGDLGEHSGQHAIASFV